MTKLEGEPCSIWLLGMCFLLSHVISLTSWLVFGLYPKQGIYWLLTRTCGTFNQWQPPLLYSCSLIIIVIISTILPGIVNNINYSSFHSHENLNSPMKTKIRRKMISIWTVAQSWALLEHLLSCEETEDYLFNETASHYPTVTGLCMWVNILVDLKFH